MSNDEVSQVSQSTGLCTFMEDTPLNGVQRPAMHSQALLSASVTVYVVTWGKETTNTKRKKRKRYTNSKQTYIDTKTLVQSCRNTKKNSMKKV